MKEINEKGVQKPKLKHLVFGNNDPRPPPESNNPSESNIFKQGKPLVFQQNVK